MCNGEYRQYDKPEEMGTFFHEASLCRAKIYRPFGILTAQQAWIRVRLMNYVNMLAVAKYDSSLALRFPLKVAGQDDHNGVSQELRETRVAGMLPCHVAQAVTPE